MQQLEAGSVAEVEIPAAQRRAKVYRHVERDKIEALLRRGKSAEWIALWLEEEFPLEDEEGNRHPDARLHERCQLGPKEIDSYRSEYMPECNPGIELLTPELEDVIGRRFPPTGPAFETEVVEAGVRAAEINLARGLAADAEMEMVQPTTLQAQAQLLEAASVSVDIKARLGVPGYEPPPERLQVEQTTRSMSIELQGQVDPKTGQIVASEPKKVELLEQLMALPAERASEVMASARAVSAANDEGVNGQVSPASDRFNAEGEMRIDSDATEIPISEELDESREGDRGAAGGDQSGDP